MPWNTVGSIKGDKGDPGDKGDNISVWTGTASEYSSVDKNAYDLYLVKQ
jgi:hypothetical protein